MRPISTAYGFWDFFLNLNLNKQSTWQYAGILILLYHISAHFVRFERSDF